MIEILFLMLSIIGSALLMPAFATSVAFDKSWWTKGQIDENEFLKGITFLVENGIIVP
ncbi:MAG: hypothetical protein ACE5RN_00225 [Nitrosopumilaceae archaeon]